jgi:hypothetical protein
MLKSIPCSRAGLSSRGARGNKDWGAPTVSRVNEKNQAPTSAMPIGVQRTFHRFINLITKIKHFRH